MKNALVVHGIAVLTLIAYLLLFVRICNEFVLRGGVTRHIVDSVGGLTFALL